MEKFKQSRYPQLDWDDRESVKIHTLSATLHNSRFSSPVCSPQKQNESGGFFPLLHGSEPSRGLKM